MKQEIINHECVTDGCSNQKYATYRICLECRKERRRIRKEADPKAHRDARYRYDYGITQDEVDLFNDATECEICGEDFNNITKHLDHCHTTGEYRGALCVKCNTAIGLFNDNTDTLLNAIKYLT